MIDVQKIHVQKYCMVYVQEKDGFNNIVLLIYKKIIVLRILYGWYTRNSLASRIFSGWCVKESWNRMLDNEWLMSQNICILICLCSKILMFQNIFISIYSCVEWMISKYLYFKTNHLKIFMFQDNCATQYLTSRDIDVPR